MATASRLRGVTHETGSSRTSTAKTEKGAAETLLQFHPLRLAALPQLVCQEDSRVESAEDYDEKWSENYLQDGSSLRKPMEKSMKSSSGTAGSSGAIVW